MKKTATLFSTLLFLLISLLSMAQETFTQRTVVTGLNSAWEVVYGPNDSLFVTENKTYKIWRIDVATGNKTLLIDLSGQLNWSLASGQQPQGGLMGLALHPNLYSSNAAV